MPTATATETGGGDTGSDGTATDTQPIAPPEDDTDTPPGAGGAGDLGGGIATPIIAFLLFGLLLGGSALTGWAGDE